MKVSTAILSFAAAVAAHGDHDHDQTPIEGPLDKLWYNTIPGDGGTQVSDWSCSCKLRTSC
jgi:agmatinase